jgi:DNA-binding MarR family transcriptional regulator
VRQCGLTDVANRLGITTAATSQLVDKLVQSQMVERTEDEHDRRVKQLTLTAKGREWVEQAMQARMKWTASMAENLSSEQRAAAMRSLDDMMSALRGLPELTVAPVEE